MQTNQVIAVLNDDEICDLRREFNLSPTHGRILALLMAQRYINEKDLIEKQITAAGSSPKVEISRIRRRLNPHGVTILSMRNMGYWFTDATKENILARLPARVTPTH